MQAEQEPIAFDTQGNLIIPGVHSANYVPGVSGWTINDDGSAEFNNLSLRGTFTGTNYVINSNGEFFYSGTPAAGNLVASVTQHSGADPFGNNYLSGFTAYDNSLNKFVQVDGGVAELGAIVAGVPDRANAAKLNGGTAVLDIQGVANASSPDAVLTRWTPGPLAVTKPTGTEPVFQVRDFQGSSVASLRVSGATIQSDINGNPFTEQTPSLGTNWAPAATTGTYQPITFRRLPFDQVMISGVFNAVTATPATTVFTLPAGYIPPIALRIGLNSFSNTGVPIAGQTHMIVNASGICQVNSTPAIVAGQNFSVSTTFPLRNVP